MEGEKLNPDWAISARSSVLRTHVGQDSFELYKACYLERDQASTFGQNLCLKCLMFRYDKAVAKQKIHELQEDLDHVRGKEKEALEAKAAAETRVIALEAQLSVTLEEGKMKVADALESGRTEGFSTCLLARKTEGITKGREAFLQSEDYKKSISRARLQGAHDFLKAPAFKLAVDLQSAQFLNDGFDKCIS
ncbi:hypothetical protein Salat_1741200 [Sesamum alatum]|uniref:Uncharacterized protein n=1 Tax=Sesamum alatum TaxID=300844 RepID=A0AAE1Y8U5_9LAMI|nr:hypothetical protein Salat_1741200 [Sesamum alatum]